jgi:plastocyanin
MKQAFVAAILLLAAGCSSDGPTTPGGGGGGGGTPPPNQRTVNIVGTSFDPSNATVAVGGTVTWNDQSGFPHDITPVNHTAWTAVNTTGSGQALQVTFPTAGTYNYGCTLHSGMNGSIVVQ